MRYTAMPVGGDKKARCTAFWHEYSRLVRGLLMRTLGRTDATVDDLVQDVFLVLLRRIDDIQSPERTRSFVVGTTLRIAYTELRRRRQRPLPEAASSLDDALQNLRAALPPNQRAETLQEVRTLYLALGRLDAEDRMAIVLRYVEGFELQEIADALEWSLATVKRHLNQAEAALRTHVSHTRSNSLALAAAAVQLFLGSTHDGRDT